MFRECLELASVDAVLNLVNVVVKPNEPQEEKKDVIDNKEEPAKVEEKK